MAIALFTGSVTPLPPTAIAIELDSLETLSPQAEALLREGTAQYRNQRYRDAEASFDRLIELNPELPEAYYNRARVRTALGEYDAAIADYSQALRLQPQFVAAYINRGLAYQQIATTPQQLQAAIADYTQAIALDDAAPIPYLNRANVYAALGEFDRALADYDRALDLDANYIEAYYNRALTYEQLGRAEAALDDYAAALAAITPERTQYAIPVYLSRSSLYLRLGEWQQAIEDCNRVLARDSQNPEAYGNRGLAYGALEQSDRAIADLERAVQLFERQGRRVDAQQARNALRQWQD